jgi:hypothetical protein
MCSNELSRHARTLVQNDQNVMAVLNPSGFDFAGSGESNRFMVTIHRLSLILGRSVYSGESKYGIVPHGVKLVNTPPPPDVVFHPGVLENPILSSDTVIK